VINKTDLAPYVGASLEVMERDTLRMRGDRPWTFTNLKSGDGLQNSSPSSKTKACSANNPAPSRRRGVRMVHTLPSLYPSPASSPASACPAMWHKVC
jgi:hypothetical protein